MTTIIDDLVRTNIGSIGFPWFGTLSGITKRWNIDQKIPLYTAGDQRAIDAAKAIEEKLQMDIFDVLNMSFSHNGGQSSRRQIIVSIGSAFIPDRTDPINYMNYRGNVAAGPNEGGYPGKFVNQSGEISARLYVNLDNEGAFADTNIAIHELGHALGLGAHFKGFGDGAAISDRFWEVLTLLYRNPIGTATQDLI